MKPLMPTRRSSATLRGSRRSLLSLLLATAIVLASLSPVLAVASNAAGPGGR